jgi:hypothetical protein
VLTRGSQYRVESLLMRLAHSQNYLGISPSRDQVGGALVELVWCCACTNVDHCRLVCTWWGLLNQDAFSPMLLWWHPAPLAWPTQTHDSTAQCIIAAPATCQWHLL